MANKKILVVEDEAVTSMDIQIMLKDLGYDIVDIVPSGEEAIQKVSERNPNLVLMAINLKGKMNGIEAARQIQKFSNVPIVYLTVHIDDETLQEAMATEPYGYITKPFKESDLRLGIEIALYKHKGDSKLRKFQHVVENCPVTVIITDTKAIIEYVNPRFTQLTGYTLEEAIGQNPSILKSDNTSPEEHKLLWNTITSGSEWRGEFCNKKKNGDIYWESATISSIKNSKGVITHFIAVKEDITLVRKLAKDQLESEERVRSIGAAAQDAIIMVDNRGCITYWNKAAEIMLGYSEKETIKRYLHEFVIPDALQEKFQNGFKNFRNTGQGEFIGKVVELTAIRRDGTEFPIELSVSVVKLKDKWNAVGIIRDITERKQAENNLKQSLKKLKTTVNGVITALALTVEQRDPYTAGHQQRVSSLACEIAKEMGLPEDQIEGICMSGIVHDIGKMHVPAEILSKPGKLTDNEFNIVKTHVQVGYDILKGIEFPWPVADIVHQHHERIDGSGYPLGLPDDNIIMEARIMCVADIIEAMASHRPYRPALGMDKALEEIARGKGVYYDSEVVNACLKLIKEKGFKFNDL